MLEPYIFFGGGDPYTYTISDCNNNITYYNAAT
jgi:hypothetical protein